MRTATLLTSSIVVSLSALASGQTAQSRSPGPTIGRYTAIGCLSRQGTPTSHFAVTDRRGDRPTVYRLEGDAALLARHVGHTVEVAGPLGPAQVGTTERVLKANSLVWLTSTCKASGR